LAYAAVAALAIAVIGLAGPSLLDRFGTGPSPSGSAETSSPSASCGGPDLPTCAGPLEPGTHRSNNFIPPIDYYISPDSPVAWDNPEDLPGTFTLHPAGPRTDAIFFFRDVRIFTEGRNIVQTPGGYGAEGFVVQLEVPGIAEDDIEVHVDGDTVVVRGQRQPASRSRPDSFHRMERTYGAFSRSFQFSEDVDPDRVTARFKDGLLRVDLPKLHARGGWRLREKA